MNEIIISEHGIENDTSLIHYISFSCHFVPKQLTISAFTHEATNKPGTCNCAALGKHCFAAPLFAAYTPATRHKHQYAVHIKCYGNASVHKVSKVLK